MAKKKVSLEELVQESSPPQESPVELPEVGGDPEPLEPPKEDGGFAPNPEPTVARVKAASSVSSLLEEAAERFLSVLNPPLVHYFRDHCGRLRAEPWQVIVAILHRCCEARDIPYFPDTFGLKNSEEQKNEVTCRNCGNTIPDARWGQLYCCNRCGSYDQGSKVIPFGEHSEECPIKDLPWHREPRPQEPPPPPKEPTFEDVDVF